MRPYILAATIAAVTALSPGMSHSATSDRKSQDADTPFVAQVVVVRASNACFSAAIRVTGYLVAHNKAVVNLSQGDRVVEVLAAAGRSGDH